MTTKEDIITLPHPNLRKPSVKVGYITNDIKDLVTSMSEALLDWEDHRQHEVGVALAAVQINHLKKVVIVRNDYDDKNDRSFMVFINPEITKFEGKLEEDFEGCLSIKDIYGKVPRYTRIKVKALDINGREFRITLEGFLARILQHEIDHTKGIVFVDHIKNHKNSFFHLENDGKMRKLNYDKEVKNSPMWEDHE